MRLHTQLLTLALWFGPSLQQQKDPLKDFCRRFGHQTAVIDRQLFIDGGLINYQPLEQNPLNYTNTGLLYADLDVDNQGMPQEYANLSKPATIPSVSGGIIWPDTINKMFYLYGGEFQSPPQSFSMYAYDVLNNNWSALNPDVTQSGIQRASYGAGVAVQDKAKGFYYGGWLSNASVPIWGAEPIALSNMLVYDMIKNSWKNSSGPDTIGRAEGVMLYLPASDGGMLVYFGGIQTPYGNSTQEGVPMDQIFLYDIANEKWYTQKASGDVPEKRSKFCAGATWAPDQSSYNIYLYGGESMPPLTVGFDDIYILSLPSFTWIKWYPTSPGTSYPHHSLSCNVIDNSQMLVMGGTFPNSSACDVPTVFAFHNMDLGKQNTDNAKWALFSSNKTGYKVPSEILAVIGGTANGGATVKAPKDGFSDRDINTYFQRAYTSTVRTPTRSIPSATPPATSSTIPVPPSSSATPESKPNLGAIVGGSVGGAAVLFLFIGAMIYLFKRKQKSTAGVTATPHDGYQSNFKPHSGAYPHADEIRPNPPAELPADRNAVQNEKIQPYPTHTEQTSPMASPPRSPPLYPPPGSPSPRFYQEASPTSPFYMGSPPSFPTQQENSPRHPQSRESQFHEHRLGYHSHNFNQ